MGAGSVTIQKMKADFPLLYGIWENPHHYYPYGRIKLSIALTRKEELERAQAARALPFPLGRKREQKGPFCTALRQQKDSAGRCLGLPSAPSSA